MADTKNKSRKQDRKLVASKQGKGREWKWISKHYEIPEDVVRQVMKDKGKNGKMCRSRRVIYDALRAEPYNYVIETRYTKGKEKK